jgi:hypothetical protein
VSILLLLILGSPGVRSSQCYSRSEDLEPRQCSHIRRPYTSSAANSPDILERAPANNYRRWWNNSWSVVEQGGQQHAASWTGTDERRLRSLVRHAHDHGLWIRFYTLDGATQKEESRNGWFRSYNFGSPAAAEQRWRAAQQAGVDYLASDQYEQLGACLRRGQKSSVSTVNHKKLPPRARIVAAESR